MSLFTLFSRWPQGQRRQPSLRAHLSVNGIEILEERAQPSLLGIVHGLLSDVTHVLNTGGSGSGGGSTSGQVANASLSGTAFVDWNGNGVMDAGDNADSSVSVTLTGTDSQGNAVSLTAQLDGNGNFSFTGLQAGTYSLTFSASNYGQASVGSAGGTQNADSSATIDGIVLTASTTASGYNFAEQPQLS